MRQDPGRSWYQLRVDVLVYVEGVAELVSDEFRIVVDLVHMRRVRSSASVYRRTPTAHRIPTSDSFHVSSPQVVSASIWSLVAARTVGEFRERGRTRAPGQRCRRCSRSARTITPARYRATAETFFMTGFSFGLAAISMVFNHIDINIIDDVYF
jgi:hypothetical protein